MRLRTYLIVAGIALAIPAASFAAPISFTTPSILKSGLKAISATIQSLAPKGSFIAQGQFVCDTGANSNCGLVSGLRGIYVPELSTYTATGGNTKVGSGQSATAKYEAVLTANAFSSTAGTRGLRTGSSATLYAVLDIVKNNTGVSYDCGLKDSSASGTGSFKVSLFDNKTATGTYIYSTPFVKGSTDVGSCRTLGTPKSNSDVRLTFISIESLVGK